MDDQKKRVVLVVGIVFVLFNVLAFALPFEMNATFWLSYIFTTVAIFSQIFFVEFSFRNGESLKSKFYGFPIARIGFMYGLAQVVAGFLFMALSSILSATIPLIICCLLLGAAAIGTIAVDGIREELIAQDTRLKKNVTAMRNLQSQTTNLMQLCEGNQLKNEIKELAEDFRYSDPVSSEATEQLESELITLISELQREIMDDNMEESKKYIQSIKFTLSERNRICKLNK